MASQRKRNVARYRPARAYAKRDTRPMAQPRRMAHRRRRRGRPVG